MESIEERLDALVERAKKEKKARLDKEEKTIDEVLNDYCLCTLEAADNITEGVVVNIPVCLIKNVLAWKNPDVMGKSLEVHFLYKILVTPFDMSQESWSFRLQVKI